MSRSTIFGLVGAGSELGAMEQMGACLAHRGNERRIFSPAPHVFLGRPLDGSEDVAGPHAAILRGRLWNRPQLLELLRSKGRETFGEPEDAGLLLDLYRCCGPAGLSVARGTFELAIHDADARALYIALGHDAVRELYLWRGERTWAFAPEIKAFARLPFFSPAIEPQRIKSWESAHRMRDTETLMCGVQRVLPGQYLLVREHECMEGSLSPCVSLARARATTPTELRSTIVSAARRLSENAAHLSVALTPGIGPLLALGAIRWVAHDIEIGTYTVGFGEDDPFIERARRIAHRFRTNHREIFVSADTVVALLPELVRQVEEPIAPERMLEYLLVAHQAALDHSTLICGLSADPPPATRLGAWSQRRSRHDDRNHLSSAQPVAPAGRELAALEQIHSWAGVELAALFGEPDVRACSEAMSPEWGRTRARWCRAVLETCSGLVPPLLLREAMSLRGLRLPAAFQHEMLRACGARAHASRACARAPLCPEESPRDLLSGRWPEIMLQLWREAFVGTTPVPPPEERRVSADPSLVAE